jgi:hypothetical protein
MFRVRVSDGVLADTITIYLGLIVPPPPPPPPTLVSTTTADPGISIFPNPASTTLNVEWTNLQQPNARIVITDMADRIFYKASLTGKKEAGSVQVDISSLPVGAYIIRINDNDVRKFVKQ